MEFVSNESRKRVGVIESFDEYDPRLIQDSLTEKKDEEICVLSILRDFIERIPGLEHLNFSDENSFGDYEYSDVHEPFNFLTTHAVIYAQATDLDIGSLMKNKMNYLVVLPIYHSQTFHLALSCSIGLNDNFQIRNILNYHYYNLVDQDRRSISDYSQNEDLSRLEPRRLHFLKEFQKKFHECSRKKYFGLSADKSAIVDAWIEQQRSKIDDQVLSHSLKNPLLAGISLELSTNEKKPRYSYSCTENDLKDYFHLLKLDNPETGRKQALVEGAMVNWLLYDLFNIGPECFKPVEPKTSISADQLLFFAAEYKKCVCKSSKRESLKLKVLIPYFQNNFPSVFQDVTDNSVSLYKRSSRYWSNNREKYHYLTRKSAKKV